MQQSEEDIAWFRSTFHPVPKPTLPEDCIDYQIHIISGEFDLKNDSEVRVYLRQVQKHASDLQKQWLKGYIWQRQSFALELKKEDATSFLGGSTNFGDSIEDEWVIVWLLKELSNKFPDLWIKVTDSDGEFLLIEASGTIPGWLEPDVAENRVWINNGHLKILKPVNASARSLKRTEEKISLQDARQIILKEPKRLMHSTTIEAEAFYRLRNYPSQIKDNMHNAVVLLPRKVAFLLLQKPAYVAPAIEAFYLRDPIALKPLQKRNNKSDLHFLPQDLVLLSVRFPKVGYAQIKSQDFPAPPVWEQIMPLSSDIPAHTRADTGMKITSGFEMLLSDPQHQDKPAVREMNMILDDLKTGDETLPSDAEIAKLGLQEDDEKWLDIDFQDFERELDGKAEVDKGGKKREFGNKMAQENLQRIVKQFEDFLNDKGDDDAGVDSTDSDSDSDEGDDDHETSEAGLHEDQEASFDEDEFTRMMQEMMGMPSDVMKEIMSGTIDALSENQSGIALGTIHERARAKVQEIDSSDEDTDDIKQMENELQATEALNLNMKTQRSVISRESKHDDAEDIEDSEDDQGLNDFDADFARNILNSFKSSSGMGGPAASLMNMINDSAAGESSKQPRRRG